MIKKKVDKGEMLHIENLEAKNKERSLREEEDVIVNALIEEIWATYNDDGNEFLDMEEFEKFISL